ncbi:MAG: ferritin-like domain-containing protein [Acidimicrobiales bacterium]
MALDDRRFGELVEESQDLHVDAMRDIRSTLPGLREIGHNRRARPVDVEEVRRFNSSRRNVLRRLGFGVAGLGARGLAYGSLGSVLYAVVGAPAKADEALDVQILQTASSLERLAVDTYDAVLKTNLGKVRDLPGTAGKVMETFLTTTMQQHEEHKQGFQAQTSALGGVPQDIPNRKFQPIVTAQVPRMVQPVDVVDFAATLEKVATDTYLLNLTMLEDKRSKQIMASVMGVEAQHLATLRAVGAMLRANVGDLIRLPIGAELARLPKAVGSVGFPDPLEKVNADALIAQPETGSVK